MQDSWVSQLRDKFKNERRYRDDDQTVLERKRKGSSAGNNKVVTAKLRRGAINWEPSFPRGGRWNDTSNFSKASGLAKKQTCKRSVRGWNWRFLEGGKTWMRGCPWMRSGHFTLPFFILIRYVTFFTFMVHSVCSAQVCSQFCLFITSIKKEPPTH